VVEEGGAVVGMEIWKGSRCGEGKKGGNGNNGKGKMGGRGGRAKRQQEVTRGKCNLVAGSLYLDM